MESQSKRILIVDDEEQILAFLEDLLTDQGYQVSTAPSARGALAEVRDQIFDVAILDFNLPDMDGVMLHRQIRQMDPELASRTLFTSGLVQDAGNMNYYETFGQGFLAKPFDISDVLDAISRLVSDTPE